MTWRMPAEAEPHERTWTAFPPGASYVADSPQAADRARTAWARVAHTVAGLEPVTMLADPVAPADPADPVAASTHPPSGIEVVELTAPEGLRDEEGRVDHGSVNRLVVTGGVVGCALDGPCDAEAKAVLESAYPGRRVVMVPARDVLGGGGGVHGITQQQPAAGVPGPSGAVTA